MMKTRSGRKTKPRRMFWMTITLMNMILTRMGQSRIYPGQMMIVSMTRMMILLLRTRHQLPIPPTKNPQMKQKKMRIMRKKVSKIGPGIKV